MHSSLRNLLMASGTALLVSVSGASAQNAAEPAAEPADTTVPAEADGAEAEVIALPEWHPEITAENAMSVEQMLDFEVYGPTGEEIGEVENILFDAKGEVLSVVAEVGGLWNIGDTHVNVPWDEVDVDPAAERITLPVTQETVEDYTLFTEGVLTVAAAATQMQEVEGDGLGVADTGPRVWRAAELINDHVRLRDGEGWINYGYVDDVIIKDGQIAAVAVRPDVTWGAPGLYAYPYYGYGYGWTPGLAAYDLPYERADVEGLEPLDEEAWDD